METTTLYKNLNYFTMQGYTISHSKILIRHQNYENDIATDIVFYAVSYLQISPYLRGVEISVIDWENALFLKDSIPNFGERNLYQISTSEGNFYIVAAFFKLFENVDASKEIDMRMG